MWLDMEKRLWKAFIARREQGRLVRDGWFRRNTREFWSNSYPDLQ